MLYDACVHNKLTHFQSKTELEQARGTLEKKESQLSKVAGELRESEKLRLSQDDMITKLKRKFGMCRLRCGFTLDQNPIFEMVLVAKFPRLVRLLSAECISCYERACVHISRCQTWRACTWGGCHSFIKMFVKLNGLIINSDINLSFPQPIYQFQC